MNKMYRLFIYFFFLPFGLVTGQSPDYSLLQIKALLIQNNYSEAINFISKLPKNNNPEIYKLNGFCYYRSGQSQQALSLYLKADSIINNSSSLEIAKCYASLSDPSNAVLWLKKYLSGTNKLSEYEITSDKAFEPIIHSEEWLKLWQKEWYTPSEIEKSAIKALIRRKEFNNALNLLENNRNVITPKSDLFYLEALIYIGLKQTNIAYTSIDKALESSNKEHYFILKSEILMERGNFSEAINNLTSALKINPNEPQFYLKRAEAARLSGNLSLAQSDMELYKKLFPEAPQTLFQLGMLESAKSNYLNALDYLTRLVEKVQNNPEYYTERGNIAFITGRYKMAEDDMATALDLNPNLEIANLIKGKIRIYFSDKETGCFYLEKASRLGNKEAGKLLEENCRK